MEEEASRRMADSVLVEEVDPLHDVGIAFEDPPPEDFDDDFEVN